MSKNQQPEPTKRQFPHSVELAISAATRPIVSKVDDETQALKDRINDLIAKPFKESGLDYHDSTNVVQPDPIALAVHQLCDAVAERVIEARIQHFFKSFSEKTLLDEHQEGEQRDRL